MNTADSSITTVPFRLSPGTTADWDWFVRRSKQWAADAGVAIQDTIVLVPFAQQLNDIRAAWGRAGGWAPKVETSITLTAACRRGGKQIEGLITFDVPTDRLVAIGMLRSVPAMAAFCREEPRAFSLAAAELVTTAHAIAKRAAAVPPSGRQAYWETARAVFAQDQGPGTLESLLGTVAMEWAAMTVDAPTDPLFELAPSGWIVLKAGGLDPVTSSLLEARTEQRPWLIIDSDPPHEDLLAGGSGVQCQVGVCEDFEDEAQGAAAQLLAHIEAGEVPVGLIAQDRSLVRRTCALLRRQGVAVNDETGWKLSTTRCGAMIVGLLKSASWNASNNQVLEWLKACDVPGTRLHRRRDLVDSLEMSMRRYGWTRPVAVVPDLLSEGARQLWRGVGGVFDELAGGGAITLAEWLEKLRCAQEAAGDWQWMLDDDVGAQVIHALRMDGGLGRPREWLSLAAQTRMGFDDFLAFVSDTLELESLVPPMAPEDKSQVIVTPLPRAMLRKFQATVFPGVDEKRLAGPLLPHPLLSEQTLSALGLPLAEERRAAEALAFAQVLRLPKLTFLRRRQDGSEPLASSSLLQRLEQEYVKAAGTELPQWNDPRITAILTRTEQRRPEPAAPELLPEALTASSLEALRDCPYKFFGTALLGLREVKELEDTLEKRDYGTWLHAVLYAFHNGRDPSTTSEQADVARMLKIGREEGRALGLDDAELVPYQASFEKLAPRYVAWQRAREAEGFFWRAGEVEVEAEIEGWGATKLRGRLDRIDTYTVENAPNCEAIDYKTGSTEGLATKAKSGLEDTQLAVYAALIESQAGFPVAAEGPSGMYLSLDDKTGVVEVRHEELGETTRSFLAGVALDLERIRAGVPLRALGEGRSCQHCSVKGLCRREHWPEQATNEE